jgi:hypothetical protein
LRDPGAAARITRAQNAGIRNGSGIVRVVEDIEEIDIEAQAGVFLDFPELE